MIKIPLVCALTVVSLHAADVGFGPALAPGMTIPCDAPVVPTDSGHGPNPALPPAARTRLDELAPDLATQDWGSLQVNRAVAGTPLTIAGRGFDARISTELDTSLPDSACVYCGNCIAVCPTGALFEKGRSVAEMRKRGGFLPYLTLMREAQQ